MSPSPPELLHLSIYPSPSIQKVPEDSPALQSVGRSGKSLDATAMSLSGRSELHLAPNSSETNRLHVEVSANLIAKLHSRSSERERERKRQILLVPPVCKRGVRERERFQ